MRLTLLLSLTVACFVAFTVGVFYTRAYATISDPNSSTGSFERAVASVNEWRADPKRDVLVLGDSRMYAGLDPTTADSAAGGLRLVNAGVPGLTPRCWFFLDRAVDPEARRFRAIVIPVDSYTDDTSAIGSLDADDHAQDLHAIVSVVTPADILPLAKSFDEPDLRRSVAFDMLLRGPILRDDFQALLSDPLARVRSIAHVDPAQFDPRVPHPFPTDLVGLRADFSRGTLVSPAWVSTSERGELEKQILRVPEPSESYAAYRRTWLWPIVRRYIAADTPVLSCESPRGRCIDPYRPTLPARSSNSCAQARAMSD